MLKHIEPLRRIGFALHWLHPHSKRPIGDDWSNKPVLSLARLRKSYKHGYNVGVRLGRWSEVGGGYLHVIDLDIRQNGVVQEAQKVLTEMFPGWRSFPTVQSGSRGESRHFYIICDTPFSSRKLRHSGCKFIDEKGTSHWTWEIELFGTGKQVAIPPSVHPDTRQEYRWLTRFNEAELSLGVGPFVDADHLAKLLGRVDDDGADLNPGRNAPLGLSIDEVKEILAELPVADYREDRDGWLTVGMALHHEFNGGDEAYNLWSDFSMLSDKYNKKDQRRVWRSFKRRDRPVRMATLKNVVNEIRLSNEIDDLGDEDEFDDLDELEEGERAAAPYADLLGEAVSDDEFELPRKPIPHLTKSQLKQKKEDVEVALGKKPPKRIAKLNERHAVAFAKGKTVVLTFEKDGSVSYGGVTDLHNFYENDRVPTDKSTEPVTKAWMRHRQRRSYPNGVVFSPNEEVEGAFNHWQGFAVEPDAKASCRKLLTHIRYNICKNNPEHYRYFIGWLAHMVQKPEEKPGVAVVLRGPKGAGKDTVGDYIKFIAGTHYVKIVQPEHLFGKFNAHQERCLFLHVEEGFFAGDKRGESTLKSLITSEVSLIEHKYANAFMIQSVLRLFMSSNEDWVVPASADERRYFVLNVSDKRRRDWDYFRAIRREMKEENGPAALLHFLLNVDLSDFNVRNVPDTEGLKDQKVQGLKNFEQWWYNQLFNGELDFDVFDPDGDDNVDWARERLYAPKKLIRSSYESWMRTQRYAGSVQNAEQISHTMKALCPSAELTRRMIDGQREYCYALPSLNSCRDDFEAWLGSRVSWERVRQYDDYDDEPDDFD